MISVINKAKYYYILIWWLIQSSEINIGTEINMKFSILVTRRDRRMDGTVSKGVWSEKIPQRTYKYICYVNFLA